MHSNEPIVYNDITPKHFKALEALAQKHGLSVVGNSGRTKKDGFDVEWNYNEEDQVLTIIVFQSPFWTPEDVIVQHFNDWVEQTKEEPNQETASQSPNNAEV